MYKYLWFLIKYWFLFYTNSKVTCCQEGDIWIFLV